MELEHYIIKFFKQENRFPGDFSFFFSFLTTLFVLTDVVWLRQNSSEQVCETEWICYVKFLFFLTRFAIRNGFVQYDSVAFAPDLMQYQANQGRESLLVFLTMRKQSLNPCLK